MRKTGKKVESGAKQTGDATVKGAKKVGKVTADKSKEAGKVTAEKSKEAGQQVGKGAKAAGKGTAKGAKKVGEGAAEGTEKAGKGCCQRREKGRREVLGRSRSVGCQGQDTFEGMFSANCPDCEQPPCGVHVTNCPDFVKETEFPVADTKSFLLNSEFCQRAGVAQLVEQLICNQQVGGSSPFASSKTPLHHRRT